LNELADRWADEVRQSENIRWTLPTSEANKFSEPLDLINQLINKSKPREVLLSKKLRREPQIFF